MHVITTCTGREVTPVRDAPTGCGATRHNWVTRLVIPHTAVLFQHTNKVRKLSDKWGLLGRYAMQPQDKHVQAFNTPGRSKPQLLYLCHAL